MENIMTKTMEKITEMLVGTDGRLKEFGAMPYGEKKATPKEQRERFENLKTGELAHLIKLHGRESVNEWLGKQMGREQ